jgi:peptidoglycan/xylan/chitin deacetylase (PgdA/CDA1 family)
MTVRTSTFRWQLEYLRSHGYQVIPLRAWIALRRHVGPPPPARSVVITVDDGHRSVVTEMLPVVREFGVPITLFIYPSAISNAAYGDVPVAVEIQRRLLTARVKRVVTKPEAKASQRRSRHEEVSHSLTRSPP